MENFKNFVKKNWIFISIVIAILILFVLVLVLLLGEKETPPVTPSGPNDEIVLPSDDFVVQQPLSYHKNYSINFESSAVTELNKFKGQYFIFTIKDVNHVSWVDDFLKDIGKENLQYIENSPTPETTIYYWDDGIDSISYNLNKEFLYLSFQQPVIIPKINFNVNDKNSLSRSLNNFAKKYFSSDFAYEVKEIAKQDGYYRVEYDRLLEGIPLHLDAPSSYLLLTLDGRIKEANFILVEFEKYSNNKFSLISSDELGKNISSMEYPKIVKFSNLDDKVEEKYDPYGYQVEANHFLQEGVMSISKAGLVYHYVSREQDFVAPVFVLEGEGTLSVDGVSTDADYKVLSSALDSKYVFVHPKSYFDALENF